MYSSDVVARASIVVSSTQVPSRQSSAGLRSGIGGNGVGGCGTRVDRVSVIVVPPAVASRAVVASQETVIGSSGTNACAPCVPPPGVPVNPPVTASAYQRIVPSSSDAIAPVPLIATA